MRKLWFVASTISMSVLLGTMICAVVSSSAYTFAGGEEDLFDCSSTCTGCMMKTAVGCRAVPVAKCDLAPCYCISATMCDSQ